MEFKGTKGDWALYQKGDVPLGNNYSIMNIGQYGVFDKDICSEWHDHSTLSEAKFNALLISKAPELLNQLQSLTDMVIRKCNIGNDTALSELFTEVQKSVQLINSATTI